MRQLDSNRVRFYSKEDLSNVFFIQKAEPILRANKTPNETDINEILELYHIKQYIDNGLYLTSWTKEDIETFKQKSKMYDEVIVKFMSNINDNNILEFHKQILFDYLESFWTLVEKYNFLNKISHDNFAKILNNEGNLIERFLALPKLV